MPRLARSSAVRGAAVLLHDVPPKQPMISDPPCVLALPQRHPELLLPLYELLQVRLAYLHPPSIGAPSQTVEPQRHHSVQAGQLQYRAGQLNANGRGGPSGSMARGTANKLFIAARSWVRVHGPVFMTTPD